MRTLIRDHRLGRGLTIDALAPVLGVSSASLRLYETGGREPHLARAMEIARFFGVPTAELFIPPARLTSTTFRYRPRGPKLSNRLRAVREAAGITQGALGRALEIPSTMVGRYEVDRLLEPRLEVALRMAGFLGAPVEDLYYPGPGHPHHREPSPR